MTKCLRGNGDSAARLAIFIDPSLPLSGICKKPSKSRNVSIITPQNIKEQRLKPLCKLQCKTNLFCPLTQAPVGSLAYIQQIKPSI